MTNQHRRVRKAVLPAAGLGTRFLPATKAQPKEMLPIVDKPLIQYVVEECVASGIEQRHHRHRPRQERHRGSFRFLTRAWSDFLESKGKTEQAELVRRSARWCTSATPGRKNPSGWAMRCLAARELVGDEPFAVLLGRRHHSRTAHPATANSSKSTRRPASGRSPLSLSRRADLPLRRRGRRAHRELQVG